MKTIAKYTMGAVMAAALLSLGSCNVSLNEKRLHGEGEIISKTIPAPEFTAVEVHRTAEVKFVEEPKGQITVSTHQNVMPYVVVTCKSGVLKITIDPAINSTEDIDLKVTVPADGAIERIAVSSAAQVETNGLKVDNALQLQGTSAGTIKGSVKAQSIGINASSAAKVDLEVETNELRANASSAARIALQGTARRIQAQASSSAKIDAKMLAAEEGDIEASSAARIDVRCSKMLKAQSSSAATIKNHCRPEQFETSQNSAGKVDSGEDRTE